MHVFATVTFLLTEQAQREAMQATGQPLARKQTVTVEIKPEDLVFMHIDENGDAYLDLAKEWISPQCEWLSATGEFDGDVRHFRKANPDVIALLRAGRAKVEAEKKQKAELAATQEQEGAVKRERWIDAFLADREARGTYRNYGEIYYWETKISHGKSGYEISLQHSPRREEVIAEIKRRNELDRKAEEALKAAAEAERDAIEATKQKFIAAWVAEHGDDVLKAQFADGLLARKTIVSKIAERAFNEASVPKEAIAPIVCDNRECVCQDESVETLPTKVYASWRELSGKFPADVTATFRKVRYCHRNDEDIETQSKAYYHAMLKLPYGPFLFERRIELIPQQSAEPATKN
jgi:hypothetical protein